MRKDGWVKNEKRYLRLFDHISHTTRTVFIPTFGEKKTDELILRTRSAFKDTFPLLPDIGEKKMFNDFILFTGMSFAMYRVLKEEGMKVEEIGDRIWEIGNTYIHKVPRLITRLVGGINFSTRYIEKLKKRAAESRNRKYPDDYVYEYIQGDGVSFDYGVDYWECASEKFLKKQGGIELAPYLCPMDILYSEMFGWGLKRARTLAEGYDRCDFRFKKGRKTDIAVPESLRIFLDKKESEDQIP